MPQRFPWQGAGPSRVDDPRTDMADLAANDGDLDLLTRLLAVLGSGAEGWQNVLDPRTKAVDVQLPNQSGTTDPRLTDTTGPMPSSMPPNTLAQPKALPKRLPHLSPSLQDAKEIR